MIRRSTNARNITKPWIILPMEVKARELYARVLLAHMAAHRGYGVIVGSQQAIRESPMWFPSRAVYFDKSISPNKSEAISKRKTRFGYYVSLDEEAYIARNDTPFVQTRFSDETLSAVDMVFCWGARDHEALRSAYPARARKLKRTGSPRIDLLRPPLRAVWHSERERIKSTRPFVLIATSFTGNNASGVDFLIEQGWRLGHISSKAQEKTRRDEYAYNLEMLGYFVELVLNLAQQWPDTKYVIRPHPSERRETYIERAESFPNIIVRPSHDSIVPWILECELFIHNSSTAAIEAYLLGQRPLSYRPIRSDLWDFQLPNDLSFQCTSLREVADVLDSIETGRLSETEKRECIAGKPTQVLGYRVDALTGALAVERILDALDTLDVENCAVQVPEYRQSIWNRLWDSIHRLASALRRSLSEYLNSKRGSVRRAEHKFPGLSDSEMTALRASLRAAGIPVGDELHAEKDIYVVSGSGLSEAENDA